MKYFSFCLCYCFQRNIFLIFFLVTVFYFLFQYSSRAKRESSLSRRGSGASFDRRGSGAGFGSGGYNSLPRRGSNATYDKGGPSSYDSLPRRRTSQVSRKSFLIQLKVIQHKICKKNLMLDNRSTRDHVHM